MPEAVLQLADECLAGNEEVMDVVEMFRTYGPRDERWGTTTHIQSPFTCNLTDAWKMRVTFEGLTKCKEVFQTVSEKIHAN